MQGELAGRRAFIGHHPVYSIFQGPGPSINIRGREPWNCQEAIFQETY